MSTFDGMLVMVMSNKEGKVTFFSTRYVPKHFPQVFNECLVFDDFSSAISCFLKILVEKPISLHVYISSCHIFKYVIN